MRLRILAALAVPLFFAVPAQAQGDYPSPFCPSHGSGCPHPLRQLGAFADDSETPVASTYDFVILEAGAVGPQGDVVLDAADPSPGATVINIEAHVDLHQRSGDVHIHTNGFVIVTEKARVGTPGPGDPINYGDLRVGLDFRQIYAAILEDWLGLPSKTALGGTFEHLPLFRA